MKASVLVVDDDLSFLSMLTRVLSRRGFRVETAESGEDALQRAAHHRFDAVITDVVMDGMDGLELLAKLRSLWAGLPVVVTSGSAGIEVALRAIREGAHDFLEKPAPEDRLVVTLENAIRFGRLSDRNQELEEEQGAPELLGKSAHIVQLARTIAKVAPSEGRVLIHGENGTGKELVASALHRGSPRAKEAFVRLNCAAIPQELVESELFGHEKGAFTGAFQNRRGRFEMADRGTLFLDEIGDMPIAMQSKLLRVLEEKRFERVGGTRPIEVDVRVVAATHRNLPAMVDAGTFREDLYYRLNVVTIEVPSLRERKEDIALLARHFLSRANAKLSLTPAALTALEEHEWPGNVRELANLIERLAILSESSSIDASEVELQLRSARRNTNRSSQTSASSSSSSLGVYRQGATLADLLSEAERDIIRGALGVHEGNKAATARALDIDRSHFHKKLRQLGID